MHAIVVAPSSSASRPERELGGDLYLEDIHLDLAFPATGEYLLVLAAGDTGGAYRVSTGTH